MHFFRVPTDALKINAEFVNLTDRLRGKILARANNFYAMLHQSVENIRLCDRLSTEREQALQTLRTLPDEEMSLVGLISTSRPRVDHLISWTGDVLEICHQFESDLAKWLDTVSNFCQNLEQTRDKTLLDALSDTKVTLSFEAKQELKGFEIPRAAWAQDKIIMPFLFLLFSDLVVLTGNI